MPKILITGSCGFIGSRAVAAAKLRGWEVMECDLRQGPRYDRDWWSEDCRDIELPKGTTHILHLAAYSSNAGFADRMWENYNNNVRGMSHILHLAQQGEARLVYASSSAAYENQIIDPDLGANSESDWLDFSRIASHYAKSKLINETMAASYASVGLNCLGLRIFNAYGKGDELKPVGRQAPPTWMQAAKKSGEPMVIYGDGKQAKDFIHVSDVVEIIMRLIESDATGIVNVGTGVATSFNDLASMVLGKGGDTIKYHPVPDPASYQYLTRADLTRLLSIIGPYEFIPVSEGVKRCA